VNTGELTIEPFDPTTIEPASVDLHFGDSFKVQSIESPEPFDLFAPDERPFSWERNEAPAELNPGEFALGTTQERVALPDDLTAQVLGRSSLGRLGVSVHQTAGFIDPGFDGQITLELFNAGQVPVRLRAGARACQIVFSKLDAPAANPYGHDGSHYQHQSGPTQSSLDFE
jgi:dCTP deaminase